MHFCGPWASWPTTWPRAHRSAKRDSVWRHMPLTGHSPVEVLRMCVHNAICGTVQPAGRDLAGQLGPSVTVTQQHAVREVLVMIKASVKVIHPRGLRRDRAHGEHGSHVRWEQGLRFHHSSTKGTLSRSNYRIIHNKDIA